MKKVFPFCFLFTILLSIKVSVYAQTPKLNNAFNKSSGIAVDSKGNVFITGNNNKIIKMTHDGKASHFAGSPHGFIGNEDGVKGKFNNTSGGMAIDAEDNLYITDNTRIRKITPTGVVSTKRLYHHSQLYRWKENKNCFPGNRI